MLLYRVRRGHRLTLLLSQTHNYRHCLHVCPPERMYQLLPHPASCSLRRRAFRVHLPPPGVPTFAMAKKSSPCTWVRPGLRRDTLDGRHSARLLSIWLIFQIQVYELCSIQFVKVPPTGCVSNRRQHRNLKESSSSSACQPRTDRERHPPSLNTAIAFTLSHTSYVGRHSPKYKKSSGSVPDHSQEPSCGIVRCVCKLDTSQYVWVQTKMENIQNNDITSKQIEKDNTMSHNQPSQNKKNPPTRTLCSTLI